MEGKVNIDLNSYLVSKLGKNNPGIVVPALVGLDAAAYDFNKAIKVAQDEYGVNEDCYTVVKSDPITFPTPNPAKYAVIVNLNDITCLGAIPYGFLATIILPITSKKEEIKYLQDSLNEIALSKNITILGGHTEFSQSVNTPIISLSMIGFTPKSFFPSMMIKPGENIYLLGYIGNEGTLILGNEILANKNTKNPLIDKISNLEFFDDLISIQNDGLKINKLLKPSIMHDPTEGGILGALFEMVFNSEYGVSVYSPSLEKHLHPLTRMICKELDIDPYRLISSGTLIFCTEKEITESELNLEHKISKIGTIIKEKKYLLDNKEFGDPTPDEIIKGLKNINKLDQ